jgi:dihydrofolate reductase
MRKVTFGVGCSLDGFIATESHGADWLMWGSEVAAITKGYWKTIDTVLMGRKTAEIAPAAGYPGVKNYVFSRSLKRSRDPGVELVRADAEAFVRELKQAQGAGICVMGGGELAHALLEADLIDEIGLNVHPVILGSGIPLFHRSSRRVALKRLECVPFENGCVFVRYAVVRGGRQQA